MKNRTISNEIMSIFRVYTEAVEPMSLDEAYLDITHLVRPDLPASQSLTIFVVIFMKRHILLPLQVFRIISFSQIS